MKANFTERPAAIDAVGNGTFKYRFNIVEHEATEERAASFDADEVVISTPIDTNAILEAVLDYLYGNGLEQKLQNDYNSFLLGILSESKATPYIEFLRNRVVLKSQIEDDYNNWLKS